MRIVARLLVLFPLFWVEGVWAVDCASTNYELNSQAEVDALGATGCDTILGDLEIYSMNQITSLGALANLTSIGGNLYIRQNTVLTTLNGLESLSGVGGYLSIYANNLLANVNALSSLTSVSGYLSISSNSSLSNIDGFSSLVSVGGYLEIYANQAALTSISGFQSLIDIGGDLIVNNNTNLTSIHGFSSLATVAGILEIRDHAQLNDIQGFSSLQSVGALRLRYNPELSNLDWLSTLVNVGGDFTLDSNYLITNYDGLLNVENIGGSLVLRGLGQQALTNVDFLASLKTVGGDLDIFYPNTLENLDGLANLREIGGSIVFKEGNLITNLDGLNSLEEIGGDFSITGSAELTDIDGLISLTRVGGFLNIHDSNLITNLDGLKNLQSVGGYLQVYNNRSLVNLDGLASLRQVGGNLFIRNNPALSMCQGIAPLLGWPIGPPNDGIEGSIQVFNESGCVGYIEVLDSVTSPSVPVINQVLVQGASLNLEFSLSTIEYTAFPVVAYQSACTASDAIASGSPNADLLDNTTIERSLKVDLEDYDYTIGVEVDVSITHSDTSHLRIMLTSPKGTELRLWDQGNTTDENLVGTFPVTLLPIDEINTLTNEEINGDWVLTFEDIEVGPLVREGVLHSWGLRVAQVSSGPTTPIIHRDLSRGKNYTCTVAPVTDLGVSVVSEPYLVTLPLQLPEAPTIISTDYEDGKIILTVSVSDNGGTDITGYEANCTDGTNTFTSTSASSPITVSGLTNEVAYTCTVTATNSVGTSSASATTGPISPEETSTGLPVWLLYQATQ